LDGFWRFGKYPSVKKLHTEEVEKMISGKVDRTILGAVPGVGTVLGMLRRERGQLKEKNEGGEKG
jgi:hypothetical protein